MERVPAIDKSIKSMISITIGPKNGMRQTILRSTYPQFYWIDCVKNLSNDITSSESFRSTH